MPFVSKIIAFYFKHVAAGKEVSDKGILELSAGNNSEKGHDVKVSAEVMGPLPTDETFVKMHLLYDTAANHAEIKESNPGNSTAKNLFHRNIRKYVHY